MRHHFDVPLRPAYDYITDPEHWLEFWPGLVAVGPGSEWSKAGDRSRVTMKVVGRRIQLDLRLERMEPYRLVEYRSIQAGMPDARHVRRFEETNGGFDFEIVVELDDRAGVRGLFDRLILRPALERAARRTGENLRHRFREGAAG